MASRVRLRLNSSAELALLRAKIEADTKWGMANSDMAARVCSQVEADVSQKSHVEVKLQMSPSYL